LAFTPFPVPPVKPPVLQLPKGKSFGQEGFPPGPRNLGTRLRSTPLAFLGPCLPIGFFAAIRLYQARSSEGAYRNRSSEVIRSARFHGIGHRLCEQASTSVYVIREGCLGPAALPLLLSFPCRGRAGKVSTN